MSFQRGLNTKYSDKTHSVKGDGSSNLSRADEGQVRNHIMIHPNTYQADWREFVSGWGAAMTNVMLTFPLNKIMFRQQLHGITTSKALQQLRKEGPLHLYRGVLPPLLQKTTSLAIMFGMYDKYQKMLYRELPRLPLLLNHGAAAMLAGCTEALLTPFERVQTLMQDRYYHKHYKNTIHAFVELRQHGVGEYYRGMSAILLRNGPSNVMFFLLRGEIKKLLPQSKTGRGDMLRDFISGGVLGASISTVYYPINVVKTKMQVKVGGDFTSFWACSRTLFEERNRSWREMFRGVHVNFSRSLISWGVINTMYEVLKHWLAREL